MEWHTHTIIYELYLRAFRDGNGDGHGDFSGLRQKLDYLQWLGVEVIWLLPINASPLRDDGYDVASYYQIHPQYGLLEDFMITLDEVHRRGMKLIVDLVMNHTSDQHPWFAAARQSVDSPMRDFYVWTDDTTKYKDARVIFLDSEDSNWAYDGVSKQYYWHRFYNTQPDLNYDNPRVHDEMLRAVDFWLGLGVDGFRLDAVPYLYEREGTSSENLPETHDFLKKVRRFVDSKYPGRLLLAEANQWPRDLMPYFGDGDELHMCFHFPIMPRLYMALAKGDRTPIIDILNDTPEPPAGTQWATFLRNHDELTLEMVSEEDRQFMWETYAPDNRYRLNLGIRRRLAPLMENDHGKLELMHSLLFTLPGVPVLYYGDEIGMGDDVSLSDRNGVRTAMQWADAPNAGFSETLSDALFLPLIRDPNYGFQNVNVEAQMADDGSLLHAVRRMTHKYRELRLLSTGKLTWLDATTPRGTLCFWRTAQDDDPGSVRRLLALHNLCAAPHTIQLPDYTTLRDAFTGDPVEEYLTLTPYTWRWLVAD